MANENFNNELKRNIDNNDEIIAYLEQRNREYTELLDSLNKSFFGRRILKKNGYVVRNSGVKGYSGSTLEIVEKEEKTSHN